MEVVPIPVEKCPEQLVLGSKLINFAAAAGQS
jgi:hypothetical protein